MQIKRNGIYKTISSSEYGIYQAMGFTKVVDEPLPKAKVEPIEETKLGEEVAVEGETEEPTVEVEEVAEEVAEPIDEVVVPKPKKKKTV